MSSFSVKLRVGGSVVGFVVRFALASNVLQSQHTWIVVPEDWELQIVTDAGTPANVTFSLSGTELEL